MREGFVRLSGTEDRYRIGECEGCGKLTPHYFPPFFYVEILGENLEDYILKKLQRAGLNMVAGKQFPLPLNVSTD